MILLPDTYMAIHNRCSPEWRGALVFIRSIGAGSSENGTAGATYQLCGDKLATNSVAGAYLSGDFTLRIDVTQGCQPITEPMVITKAEGNLIYQINQRPALEVFARLLKGPLAEDIRRAVRVIFVGLPARPPAKTASPTGNT